MEDLKPLMEDLKPFGLGYFVSLISNIEVSNWGNRLTIYCLYNPDILTPYSLIFENCHNIAWSVHDTDVIHESEVSILDISIINELNQYSATVYTTMFEISVMYGTLIVNKE